MIGIAQPSIEDADGERTRMAWQLFRRRKKSGAIALDTPPRAQAGDRRSQTAGGRAAGGACGR